MCKFCDLKWSEKAQRYEGDLIDGFWLEQKKDETTVNLCCTTEISFDKIVETGTEVSHCPKCGRTLST